METDPSSLLPQNTSGMPRSCLASAWITPWRKHRPTPELGELSLQVEARVADTVLDGEGRL